MGIEDYLGMWRGEVADLTFQQAKDVVVGSFDEHNAWPDYDEFLFKDIDTTGSVALEYGCGPGRNIVKFKDRFARIDGVDIRSELIEYAKQYIKDNDAAGHVYVTDGKSVPTDSAVYDVVFSVICLQHIGRHDVRTAIFNDIFRVLKPGGHLCFQMGFNGCPPVPSVNYFDNNPATEKFYRCDVSFDNEQYLIDDLTDIGFVNYRSWVRPTGPNDGHNNWLWVQVRKPVSEIMI
jgi:SAM-dependent methyltransferase